MSNRQDSNTRTIHPRALKELGEEACIVVLGVARDLRSGAIRPDRYDQVNICGSACCIAGHLARRLDRPVFNVYYTGKLRFGLFSGAHPSDPQLAADAIERYVYDGSEIPWQPTFHG